VSDEEHDRTPVQRPRPSAGNWGLLLLLVGVLGFVAWGIWLVTRPQPTPDASAPAPGDAARAVELIRGVADTYRDDADARAECLGALRVLSKDGRTAGLTECLRLGDECPDAWSLRGAAGYFAAEFARDDERLVGPLAEALRIGSGSCAAYALARSQHHEALAALAEEARRWDKSSSTSSAIWGLAIWPGPEATDVLLEGVAQAHSPLDNGYLAAELAVRALGYRSDSSAYRPLVSLLKAAQPTEELSWPALCAAVALGYLGQEAALKHLRDAAHRLGDYGTAERLAIAFALCRLRPPDDYNFRLLAQGVERRLPAPPYRELTTEEQAWSAIPLIVQLPDERVRGVLVAASHYADGWYATALEAGFYQLGVHPVWDPRREAWVLQDLPPGERPSHPPWEIVPPWPFSEVAGRGEGGGGADGLDSRS
jgi:hypothetical protein